LTAVGHAELGIVAQLEEDDRLPIIGDIDVDVLGIKVEVGIVVDGGSKIVLEVGITAVIVLILTLRTREDDVEMGTKIEERLDAEDFVVSEDKVDELDGVVADVVDEVAVDEMSMNKEELEDFDEDKVGVEDVGVDDVDLDTIIGEDEDENEDDVGYDDKEDKGDVRYEDEEDKDDIEDNFEDEDEDEDGYKDVGRVVSLMVVVMVTVMNDVQVDVGRSSAGVSAMLSLVSFRSCKLGVNLRLDEEGHTERYI
jgi:hypothetical protein